MRRFVHMVVVAAVAGWLPACSGDGTTGPSGPSGPPPPSSNRSPQLLGISDQTVTAGDVQTVTISATDADGDQLTFSVPSNPGFVSIKNVSQSGNTATATCEIAPSTAGSFSAEIRVIDGRGGSDTESFSIDVEAPAAVPEGGEWTAAPRFGDLTFEVNASGTAVTSVSLQFYSFSCGSFIYNGGVRVSRPAGWPIEGNSFSTGELDISPNLTMTINGSFVGTDEATGDWVAMSGGTRCSGAWEASPGSSSPGGEVTFGYIDPDIIAEACIRGNAVPPTTVSGTISSSDCLDEDDPDGGGYWEMWRVKVANTSNVTFEVESNLDSFLLLIEVPDLDDPDTSIDLAYDDDSGSGLNAKLTYRLVEDHEYAIIIAGYDTSEVGSYALHMTN